MRRVGYLPWVCPTLGKMLNKLYSCGTRAWSFVCGREKVLFSHVGDKRNAFVAVEFIEVRATQEGGFVAAMRVAYPKDTIC